jgi:phage terminase large subunit-like protein
MASPPLWMTHVSPEDVARGDGDLIVEFQERFCRTTKDGYYGKAGSLIQFRPWQRGLAGAIYARRPGGRRRHRTALIGLPRKNGKSAIGSGFALHGLLTGGMGAEVYSLACDKDQARIVFGVAKRMVQMEPQLDFEQGGRIKCYQSVLEDTKTGSIYKALSSEAYTKEGLNPTLAIYDELHAAPDDDLYDVINDAFGARLDPMLIAITTAGVKLDITGGESICYRLYQYGQKIINGEVKDDSFFMAWWGAPDDADASDPKVWQASNPAYGDLLDPEDFTRLYTQAANKGSLPDFKTKKLNMFVSAKRAWFPDGAWPLCRHDYQFIAPPKGVVLGFDGSRNGDSTALIAVTVEACPKVKVLGIWEKPLNDEEAVGWRVPREEVKQAIREACRTWDVREVAADEYIWVSELEELLEEGIPVVSFPQTMTRMGPATQRLYELVVTTKNIWQDGNPVLTRHISSAQLRIDARGQMLQKDAKNSARKIDAAVALVMAVDRAAYWFAQDGPDTFMGKPVKDIGFVW